MPPPDRHERLSGTHERGNRCVTGVLIGTISSRKTATMSEARFKRFACLDAIDRLACIARLFLLCNIPVGRQSARERTDG
jgi:hypothetical protein